MNAPVLVWTPERVGDCLVEAFRLMPTTPIYSPRVGVLQDALGRGPIGPLDVLGLTAHYLGAKSRERLWLCVWAKAQAGFEPSAREWYRAQGISQRTFYASRRRALAKVAEGLNRDGVKAE